MMISSLKPRHYPATYFAAFHKLVLMKIEMKGWTFPPRVFLNYNTEIIPFKYSDCIARMLP